MSGLNISVLIADDNQHQLDYLCHLVQRIRPQWTIVARCTSAEQVSALLLASAPSFALLDIQFSDSTALELVRNLRSHLPVICVTGEPSFAADAFSCDAVDFIVKPVKQERLEQAFRKMEAHLAGSGNSSDANRRAVSSIRILRGQREVVSQI